MNINISANKEWFEYDLENHFISVEDGALWVHRNDENGRNSRTVAVFAKGEWSRVDFENIRYVPFPASEDF